MTYGGGTYAASVSPRPVGKGSWNMATTRANVRRNEKDKVDQEVPPQAPPQALIGPLAVNVTNENLRIEINDVYKSLYRLTPKGEMMCLDSKVVEVLDVHDLE
uniref:Uncharacterized protein n=1 Tax=Solanum tuberosum TaxID=4113 RepID=M1DXP3_SOLTU